MPVKKMVSKDNLTNDPLDVTPRMYAQVAKLLDQLEAQDVLAEDGVTVPQRIQALIATGRIMKMIQDIKRGTVNAGAGTAVNKYAAAFKTPDATGGRSNHAGHANVIEFDRPDPDTDPYADD